jgi:hypothetical protein
MSARKTDLGLGQQATIIVHVALCCQTLFFPPCENGNE